MEVTALLSLLRERGYTLTPEGDRLRVRGPGPLTPELSDAVRGAKGALLALLTHGRVATEEPGPEDRPARRHPPSPETVEMGEKLKHLLNTRGWARMESGTLGGEIVLFVQNAEVQVPECCRNHITYTRADLERLQWLTPEALWMTHELIRIFGGSLAPRSRVGAAAGREEAAGEWPDWAPGEIWTA